MNFFLAQWIIINHRSQRSDPFSKDYRYFRLSCLPNFPNRTTSFASNCDPGEARAFLSRNERRMFRGERKKERGERRGNRVCINGGRKLGSFLSVHLLVSMEFLRVCCHRNGCAYPGSSDSNHPPPNTSLRKGRSSCTARALCILLSMFVFDLAYQSREPVRWRCPTMYRDDVSKNTGVAAVGARWPFQCNLRLLLARALPCSPRSTFIMVGGLWLLVLSLTLI